MTSNSLKTVCAVILAACAFGVAGCASSPNSEVRIYGDEGAGFTVRVETAGGHDLSISTVLHDQEQGVFSSNSDVVTCELRKDSKSSRIGAEVLMRGGVVVRGESPPGTTGVRLKRTNGEWESDPY